MSASASTPDNTKSKTDNDKATDDAFQALLSSQRDILAQMNFGNSSSELHWTEGPDNLVMVSPHASGEFHSSYSDYQEYPEYEEEYLGYQHQQDYYYSQNHQHNQPYHHHQHHDDHQSHNHNPSGEYYYRESLRDYQHYGVGDDRFILDHITIGPGDARGREVFDEETENRMRRKRETEQELVEVVAQRKKKQRQGSFTYAGGSSITKSDLLPDPSDLAELDDSSSASLLLDDFDFPSIHSDTDAAMVREQDENVKGEQDSNNTTEEDAPKTEKPEVAPETEQPEAAPATEQPKCEDVKEVEAPQTMKAEAEVKQSVATTAEKEVKTTRQPPMRSQRSLWKPRSRPRVVKEDSTSDMSVDQRSLWKPRKRDSNTLNDSCASLHMEDLESPVRSVSRSSSSQSQKQEVMNVSIMDGDISMEGRPPLSRTSSNDSTSSQPTVKALSVALQQSLGSTKSIQEWDRKMGLKRSHSKTMRLTSKSREQLLAFLQQEQEELETATPAAVTSSNGAEEAQEEKDEEVLSVVEL